MEAGNIVEKYKSIPELESSKLCVCFVEVTSIDDLNLDSPFVHE